MPSIKSPCLALLVLSLVVAALPVPVRRDIEDPGAKRAVLMHVALVSGDDSCDEPAERALLTGPAAETRNALVADPDPISDDEDQGDEVSTAPVALDDVGLRQDYAPPSSDSVPAFDVVIRGEKTLSAVFSRAGPAVGPVVPEEEPGKAPLLLQGLRTAAQGPWFEVESGRRLVGLNESTATDGRPSPRPSRPETVSSGALPADRSPSAPPAKASAAAPAAR